MNSHYIINQTDITIKHSLNDTQWTIRIFVNGAKVRQYTSQNPNEDQVINSALVIAAGIVG